MKILPTDFDGQAIRRVYDESTETWWFSVIDVVQVLTDSSNANRYWSDLKRKLAQEAGSEQPYEKIVRLKLTAPDGKQRETDCATAETLLRVVQTIPSPKAEPIKLWLAKVGYERMQEMADPALSLDRARQTWQQHGRSDKWIQQRMTGQETRNKLTDYWSAHDIKAGSEFAILTNIIHQEWSGLSVAEHKAKKGLSSHNLRDHMSEAELIFTALAELSTRQIAESTQAIGMQENKTAATTGGRIARQARNQLEAQTGKSVVTGTNYLPPPKVPQRAPNAKASAPTVLAAPTPPTPAKARSARAKKT